VTRALERVLADACLGDAAGDAMARDLRGFLAGHGVAPEDVEATLAAPQGLAVYRSLVRNGLWGVIARMLPRTRARLNALGGRFDADVSRFLDEVGPRTHYLRDVPAELLAWADPRWRADPAVPRYVPDLAAYELASFAVAASASIPSAVELDDVALDRAVVFDASARLLRFAWAVHELEAGGVENAASGGPSARDVRLLAYRDAEHAVRWLELSPFAWSLTERLLGGDPLGEAVGRACAVYGAEAGALVEDIAKLLADLGARGVLLGAAGPAVPEGP
jgi:hypothetical protein